MIELAGVSKSFGDTLAVNSLDLRVFRGEFLTLLGPSGCGKTTTLRMIAGFEQPSSGEIFIDGRPVAGFPPYRRNVNTVFQSYALFPHMNVFDNVAFGLALKKVPRQEIRERVMEALAMVQLKGLETRRPKQLSGGQQQRVAVARAIVNRPKVLLLDEPLGALDLKLRKQMQVELKHLQQKLGITFIYVTHDQEEALTMSDRIAVMNGGVIEQLASATEIYRRPKTRFVADFVGETNLFSGPVVAQHGSILTLEAAGVRLLAPAVSDATVGRHVHVSVRPEAIRVEAAADASVNAGVANRVTGQLVEKIFAGSATRLVVRTVLGQTVTALTQNGASLSLEEGSTVSLVWEPAHSAVMVA